MRKTVVVPFEGVFVDGLAVVEYMTVAKSKEKAIYFTNRRVILDFCNFFN